MTIKKIDSDVIRRISNSADAQYQKAKAYTSRAERRGDSPELSNRQRKHAKKQFKKGKQLSSGMKLTARMYASIDSHPAPTERLKREFEEMDNISDKLFHKVYDNCTNQQKSKVIDFLHPDKTDINGKREL